MDQQGIQDVRRGPCEDVPERPANHPSIAAENRISIKNGSRIRTSFYFLSGVRDPMASERSPIDMT
jgi:hypothetical protein